MALEADQTQSPSQMEVFYVYAATDLTFESISMVSFLLSEIQAKESGCCYLLPRWTVLKHMKAFSHDFSQDKSLVL